MYDTNWCIGETGAAGPSGNGYGDPAGYSCFAVAGIKEKTNNILTGSNNRVDNMFKFSKEALKEFLKILKN